MPLPHAAIAASTGASEVARGLTVAAVTALVIVAVILGIALVLLFRRRQGAQPSSAAGLDGLRIKANILLVRADEAVAASADELGFAVAQFGAERTADYRAALDQSRADLAEAFRLQQALDDAVPESAPRRREWILQITALCETVIARLASQNAAFRQLRTREADSPARIGALRRTITETRERVAAAEATLSRMRADYDEHLTVRETGSITDARDGIAAAEAAIVDAEARVSPGGASAVDEALHTAEQHVAHANTRLEAVETRAANLADATSALERLLAESSADLAEARRERDAASDPDSAAVILEAVARVESTRSAVSAATARRDPVAAVDELSAAVAQLDTALASARNQAQRLAHARAALVGTIATASSQISELQHLLAGEGRRVGVGARTRLAEAERQLALARLTTDPLEALSAARLAVTHARDGEALAHYDTMGAGR